MSVYDRGMSAFSGSAGVTAASVAAAGYYSYNQHYPTAADLYASPSVVDQLDFTMLHHTDVSLSTNVSRCTRATLCHSEGVCECVCVCVCPSQVGVLSNCLDGLSWFLAWRLLSTGPTLCFKEIHVSPKVGLSVIPSGTFS